MESGDLRETKTAQSLCVRSQQTIRGESEQTVERMHDGHNEQAREENRTGRASMESWVECGCGKRIDSPATPTPQRQ